MKGTERKRGVVKESKKRQTGRRKTEKKPKKKHTHTEGKEGRETLSSSSIP